MSSGRVTENALSWPRIARDAVCLVGLIWFAYGLLVYRDPPLIDARMYWEAPGYGVWGQFTFSYPPPLLLAFRALHVIPWPLFASLWTAMNLAIAVWLLRPAPWLGLVLAMPLLDAIRGGQIELLMAFCIVIGFRYPASWSLPILAKVTPGVGVLWFIVRREWRKAAAALGATAAIVALSVYVAPGLWAEWFAFLRANAGGASHQWPVLRLVAAAGLVVWGASTGRRWTVLVAAVLALPLVYIHSLAMLAAMPRSQSQR